MEMASRPPGMLHRHMLCRIGCHYGPSIYNLVAMSVHDAESLTSVQADRYSLSGGQFDHVFHLEA